MTLIVAFILAGMTTALKDIHEKNEAIFNKKAVLAAIQTKLGNDIKASSLPDDEVLSLLKSSGWRWSRFNGLWYNRLTPENLELAKNLAC